MVKVDVGTAYNIAETNHEKLEITCKKLNYF